MNDIGKPVGIGRCPEGYIELKSDPDIFQLHADMKKAFDMREVRDRKFGEARGLYLREFDRKTQLYSGRELTIPALWVLFGPAYDGLNAGHCIVSLNVAETRYFGFVCGRGRQLSRMQGSTRSRRGNDE